jgi:hypothetical protein
LGTAQRPKNRQCNFAFLQTDNEPLQRLPQVRSEDDKTKRDIAPLAASAAWQLGQWERLPEYVGQMEDHRFHRPFYCAILAVRTGATPHQQ